MVKREGWIRRIESAWKERNVVWLSGVRRVGKTCLCQTLEKVEYFDCELPRVRRQMEDPQAFLEDLRSRRVVLDEIHRLPNPSEILKVAADHYPDVKIVATGSSTLGASSKFRDTLTGRKVGLWLTPMALEDLDSFGKPDLAYRLLRGGLPPFFLAAELPERDFQEWMDAYWAKDIQELFRVEKRYSFLKFADLLLTQSGGMFEATRFARACEASRTSISHYLSILEETFVVHVIRPFSTHRPTEIVAAPKVYGFDTGFVCYYRGWQRLREDDFGPLWEHLVLNEMHAQLQNRKVHYWRDKQGHEVDFVLTPRRRAPVALECKWSANDFDPRNLKVFRRHYPTGRNLVAAQDVNRTFRRKYDAIEVEFLSLPSLLQSLLEVDSP